MYTVKKLLQVLINSLRRDRRAIATNRNKKKRIHLPIKTEETLLKGCIVLRGLKLDGRSLLPLFPPMYLGRLLQFCSPPQKSA